MATGRRRRRSSAYEFPVDGGAAGPDRGAVLCRRREHAARAALHAVGVRLLGWPRVAHDVTWIGQDPCVEGGPRRGGHGARRRPHRDVHRHGEDLRRPRTGGPGALPSPAPRRSHGPRARSARRTRGSSRGTRSTPDRCRSPGPRPDGCSWGSISNGPRCSTRMACRRDGGAGAVRRFRTRPSVSGSRGPTRWASSRPRCPPPSGVAVRAPSRSPGHAVRSCSRSDGSPTNIPCTPPCRPSRWPWPVRAPTRPWPSPWIEASEWRARDMTGTMVQGEGAFFVLGSDRLGGQDRRRDRDGPASRGRCAGADHPEASGLVEGLVQRQQSPWRPPHDGRRVLRRGRCPAGSVWEVASDPHNLPHWDRHIQSVTAPTAACGRARRTGSSWASWA